MFIGLLVVLCSLAMLGETLNFPDPSKTCPKVKTIDGDCKHGTQDVKTIYYKMTAYGKCIRHISEESLPCGGKKHCPKIRILSKDKCRGGFARSMIIRYKWDDTKQVCKKKTYFLGLPCGHEAENTITGKKRKSKKNKDCPKDSFFEEPCESEIRPVFKLSYAKVGDRCIKHIEYTSEPCATLDTKSPCPQAEMISRGPCDAERNQFVLKRVFKRDDKGTCLPQDTVSYEECKESDNCPEEKELDSFKECHHGERHVLVEKWSKDDAGKCKAERVIKYEPCGKSFHGVCPKHRYMSPGHCLDNGYFRVLVIHYKLGRDRVCRRRKSMFEKPCSEMKEYKSDKGCPEPTYKEESCADGLRHVIRTYFTKRRFKDRNGETKKHCQKHVELRQEPCVYTDSSQKCPFSTTSEVSKCEDGQMTVSEYSWEESEHGCHQIVKRVHHSC